MCLVVGLSCAEEESNAPVATACTFYQVCGGECGTCDDGDPCTEDRCIDLAGRDTLGEAVDLLSLATCVLTNDSGLMHVAAAVGAPLVAIYGPTSSHYTPPLSERVRILSLSLDCQPCFKRTCPLQHHHCMEQLLPESVLEAIDSVISV